MRGRVSELLQIALRLFLFLLCTSEVVQALNDLQMLLICGKVPTAAEARTTFAILQEATKLVAPYVNELHIALGYPQRLLRWVRSLIDQRHALFPIIMVTHTTLTRIVIVLQRRYDMGTAFEVLSHVIFD